MEQTFLPEHFINRELSWLEFNARVLEEAQDPTTPLLERAKFLSIFSSNLDEFFMVRVAGLREQAFEYEAPQDYNPDGMRATSQLQKINERASQLVLDQYACWADEILPALKREGIRILPIDKVKDVESLDNYFRERVYPIITPMAIDPSHPRPRYHNRGLYIAVMLRRRSGIGPKRMFAVVQIPQVLPRLVPVNEDGTDFVWLEDLVCKRLPELFGGHEVQTSAPFRLTRDSDLDLIHQESDDMLKMIEDRLKLRRRADAMRLEVAADADDELVHMIVEQEQIRVRADYNEVYRIPGPLDLTSLLELHGLHGFESLRDKPSTPRVAVGLRRIGEDIFEAIRRRDILLHHPFEDFAPVVEFIRKAANDPKVLAIKQTLYRTSGDSPIVQALVEAAELGKHVTALVELQARFDEEANVTWARHLEQSGVHVVYGFLDLKTHCKVSMVVREEDDGVQRYVHLGTGNYNPTTAKFYTDMGLFTSNVDFASDVSALFNLLTGYSQGYEWKKLVVAPMDLHNRTIALINEQADRAREGKPSRIFAKLNSLIDHQLIEALYKASQVGVPIDLIVRGICGLRPGITGISDTITVRSIVDRFLEHSRLFVFGPDDDYKMFLSSADWMPRNFFRRVESMFPIESSSICKTILTEVIPAYMADNVKARQLRHDGTYVRVEPGRGEMPFRVQQELLKSETIDLPKQKKPRSANGSDKTTSKKKARAK
ncbi:polyphosphate kinase 1 [Planctomycetota bacterium]